MNKPLTPFEQQLQQFFPDIYQMYLLMQEDTKLRLLLDTVTKYYQSQATGAITIDYSKGRISHIDTRIRITAESGR